MQLDEPLGQSQSQPRALLAAAVGGVHLLELGENASMVAARLLLVLPRCQRTGSYYNNRNQSKIYLHKLLYKTLLSRLGRCGRRCSGGAHRSEILVTNGPLADIRFGISGPLSKGRIEQEERPDEDVQVQREALRGQYRDAPPSSCR